MTSPESRLQSYKEHFATALGAMGETLHFAAHSHHLWPDVTREAHDACWHNGAGLNDAKWGHILGEVLPQTQRNIAAVLGLPHPDQIVFGPNVHGFVLRLFSCLPTDRPARVLTTDGEFHSFARQSRRYVEDGLVELDSVPCDPFDTLHDRLADKLRRGGYDMVYLSQVFFDSGRVLPRLGELVEGVRGTDTIFAIDGYHGFCAVPTDLAPIADRVFYLAGGYKYAMSGEGCCFMAVPAGSTLRPRNTGWFADFSALDNASEAVGYADDGWRFAGATFDPSGLYRMNAVFGLLETLGLTVADIHRRIGALQSAFLERLDALSLPGLSRSALIRQPDADHGHFLTFDLGTPEAAQSLVMALASAGVRIDSRAARARFGFGLYHDPDDIDELARRLGHTLEGANA